MSLDAPKVIRKVFEGTLEEAVANKKRYGRREKEKCDYLAFCYDQVEKLQAFLLETDPFASTTADGAGVSVDRAAVSKELQFYRSEIARLSGETPTATRIVFR